MTTDTEKGDFAEWGWLGLEFGGGVQETGSCTEREPQKTTQYSREALLPIWGDNPHGLQGWRVVGEM